MSNREPTRPPKTVMLIAIALTFAVAAPSFAQRDDYSGAPIHYASADVHDPVAKLSRRIEKGEVQLKYERPHGYLKSVLAELRVPVESQVLVFSKTSMQQRRISPRRPRAIYFSDDVYVGYCQYGDVLEFAATDARQGASFYTLRQTSDEKPALVRDRGQCLLCHSSSRTQDVPGYLIRSVFATASGQPEFGSGTFNIDHTSPLKDRWGGWYVTGTHGDMRHMGNAIYNRYDRKLDREKHANRKTLEGLVTTSPYLSPHSDIVALMVLEHQAQTHNALAWANYETRRAVHQSEVMNEALERPSGFLSDSAERRIQRATDRVLQYLLMCDEFPLTSPIEGGSGFREQFEARGPRDPQGRSLRDFDLKTRMFRYPCSYLIYSQAFDGLPSKLRQRVLNQLKLILEDKLQGEPAKRFAHLSKQDRVNIKQILLATKPDFAALHREDDHGGLNR